MKKNNFGLAAVTAMALLIAACAAPNSSSKSDTNNGGNTGGNTGGSGANNVMTTWVIGLESVNGSNYTFAQYKVPAITLDTWTHVQVTTNSTTFNYAGSTFDIAYATKLRLMGTSNTVAGGSSTCFYISNLSVKQSSNVLYTTAKVPDTGFYGAQPDQTANASAWTKAYVTNADCLGLTASTVASGSNDIGPSGYVGVETQWNFDSSAPAVTGSAGQQKDSNGDPTTLVLPDGVIFDFWIYIPSQLTATPPAVPLP